MFDASKGRQLFNNLYDKVLVRNDTQLWYEGGYVTWECWMRVASDMADELGSEDMTDLMAYIIECNPDNVGTAFSDGFTFLLGATMENEYEMGE